MAQDDGHKQPTAEELVNDPKYKETKDRMFSYFDAYVKVRSEEHKAAKKNQTSALDILLNPASLFSDS